MSASGLLRSKLSTGTTDITVRTRYKIPLYTAKYDKAALDSKHPKTKLPIWKGFTLYMRPDYL